MPFDAAPGNRDDLVYRRRLLELCRVLEGVSDSSFDLRDWSKTSLCRTVSCAVGWATKDAWFHSHGFTRRNDSPAFAGDTGWIAVRRFFGLNREEALHLFHAASYERPTRKNVLARIRAHAERPLD